VSDRARLLSIKREFLLEKHKECEAIINQDKFSLADVERLQGYYNMCEEYAGLFKEFVPSEVVIDIVKRLNPQAAVFKSPAIVAETLVRIDKKKDD
jgi:hypothetical protein